MFPSFINTKRAGQGFPDENGIDMGQSDYGSMPSLLDAGQAQPQAPNAGQMFLGGIKNNQGRRGNRILQGLSGFSGSGGFMGGLGNVASFLI